MEDALLYTTKFGSYYSFMKVGVFVSMAGTLVMAMVLSKFRKVLGKNKKKTIAYIILGTLLVALTTLPVNRNIFNLDAFWAFNIMQVALLALGLLHVFLLRKMFDFKEMGEVWPEMLFTIAFTLICFAPFMMVFKYFNEGMFNHYFLGALILLAIPMFLAKAFDLAIAVPSRVFKKWYFPLNQEVEKPKDTHLKNLLTISFHFRKKPDDKRVTNFKVNAPEEMDFGQLFYYFLIEYNNKHPEQTIELLDNGEGSPHGWIFYHRPRWYQIFNKYIIPNKTIFKNKVRENSTVICERVN